MEMSLDGRFWHKRRVFLTGHTGFKGSWLGLWLSELGSEVFGYSLRPPTQPNLFETAGVADRIHSTIGDINDDEGLGAAIEKADPEIVIHMAAQPLVQESYRDPTTTYRTNVVGTANVLQAAITRTRARVILNVTTDKVYENREWNWAYRESDQLGGHDPYSTSKACSELVTASYRRCVGDLPRICADPVGIATARAGNVIGGGDWAANRLVPDAIRSLMNGRSIELRNPKSVRPWQHVLDPLNGYLQLCEALFRDPASYSRGWNFGPDAADVRDVQTVASMMSSLWTGASEDLSVSQEKGGHEAGVLLLDSTEARVRLGWRPRLGLPDALSMTVDWARAFMESKDMQEHSILDIRRFMSL